MTQKDFYKIVNYIKQIISGSEYENHVYSVGGAVRDLLMNNEIKDIAKTIEEKCKAETHAINVEDIQEMVEDAIIMAGKSALAKESVNFVSEFMRWQ